MYWKKALLTITIVFFAIVLFTVFSYQYSNLFFIPMLAICFFLAFYFNKQAEKDDVEQMKTALRYAEEDIKAEKWIKESFAPDSLTYIRANRWFIIVYSFIFIIVVTFIWSYLTNGLMIALRNFSYAGVLFWSFILYVLIAPSVFVRIRKSLPQSLVKLFNNDWGRGYIFLMPITFLIYILFPYDALGKEFMAKLYNFPIFFLVYSSFFLCVFCITYMYEDIKADSQKRLKKEIRKELKEAKG